MSDLRDVADGLHQRTICRPYKSPPKRCPTPQTPRSAPPPYHQTPPTRQTRARGQANHTKARTPLGMRWTVERTNSWLSNYGQLRRNTDRYPHHRQAQLQLAITLLLTAKLIDWRNRWSHNSAPIR